MVPAKHMSCHRMAFSWVQEVMGVWGTRMVTVMVTVMVAVMSRLLCFDEVAREL